MDQFLYGIPILGVVFQLVRLSHRRPPDERPDHPRGPPRRSASVPCAASSASARAWSTSASRARCSTAAFTGWVIGIAALGILGSDAGRARSGVTPALVIALIGAVIFGGPDLAPPRVDVDQPADRPDHQRHDHQHRGVRHHGLPEQRHRRGVADERGAVRQDQPAVRRWRSCRSSAGSSRPCSTRDRSRSRCSCSPCVLQILLFRSRWGLRTRAVGEHPKAAETVGIDVIRLRYRNVLLGGALRRAGRSVPVDRAVELVPGGRHGGPRLHRAGGGHRRSLDAASAPSARRSCSRSSCRWARRSRSWRRQATWASS